MNTEGSPRAATGRSGARRSRPKRGQVFRAGRFFLGCWHGETDTLPWVERRADDAGLVDVVLPFGVASVVGEVPRVSVEVDIAGERRTYGTEDGGGISPVTPSSVARRVGAGRRLRGEPGVLELRHHLVDIAEATARNQQNAFFQLVVERVPRDAVVRYTISATTALAVRSATVAFELQAAAPDFGPGDLCGAGGPRPGGAAQPGLARWALLHRRAGGFDHLRLDLLSTIPDGEDAKRDARPAASIEVDGAPAVVADADWSGRPDDEYIRIPLIDRELDSILVSVPVPPDGHLPHVEIRTGRKKVVSAARVELAARIQPVRLMFINYCIQQLNDLFEVPNDKYDPPRTYMQVTMRDERGSWSSRPGSAEDGDPDGYALTLDAHRYYGVPSMWAFNAGVLTMIAHDCPDELRRIRDDVRAGLVLPVNAGFGAHRPPYYTADTNREEIRRGQEVISAFIPEAPPEGLRVYYPDQRLYEATAAETEVYAEDDLVTHLVLDRSTLCSADHRQFFPHGGPAANRLLRDPRTGGRLILPIEDEVRDAIIAGDEDDRTRGKASPKLREILLDGLPAAGGEPPLLVYADDADKASGCGWFDGDYSGLPVHFNEGYQATLCWLSRHPWVRVVTVADLNHADAADLESTLQSATCPSVDPGGASTTDQYHNRLHFDTWRKVWAEQPAHWLGQPLGVLSDRVEQGLVTWPADAARLPQKADESLVDLAWMTFLGLHHEMMWNKEPLEGAQVNDRLGVLSPEDFVVAASLQMRNAQVYLGAAVWSAWARTTPGSRTHVNDGPLLDLMVRLGRAGAGGRFWDDDLLPNDLLYNDQVLAVLDRNGGRITHLFMIDPATGRALCVSGTPKAYQWTGPAPGRREWLTGDGGVLENTVLTPNHLYVASDLREARPRVGWRHEDRPRQSSPRRWLYPDTFNEYEAVVDPRGGAVRYTYGPASGTPQPEAGALLEATFNDACANDSAARSPGGDPGRAVIWRETGGSLAFVKTIALTARRLTVHYEQAPPGHLVGNEFCVDVHAGLTGGGFQQKWSDADGRTVIFQGPRGGRVSLTAGPGCELTAASLLSDLATARTRHAAADYLRLHRVLTDAVEIRCRAGGSFDYVVTMGP